MICKIENAQVIETHIVKLLGIQIDTELTFNSQIKTLCKKASQKLNALSRLCVFLPFHRRKMLMQLILTLLRTHCTHTYSHTCTRMGTIRTTHKTRTRLF